MPNGQDAQAAFDKNLLHIKNIVESQAGISGKTYAISDIHGMYNLYIKAIQQLNENNTLIILGDVIDRGKDGIAILKDIIKRQKSGNGPRIIFLLGNHEMQMIECLKILEKYRPTMEELELICEAGESLRANWNDSEINKKIILEKPYSNFSKNEIFLLYVWIKASKGKETFAEFDALSTEEQQDINELLTKKSYMYLKKKLIMEKYYLFTLYHHI